MTFKVTTICGNRQYANMFKVWIYDIYSEYLCKRLKNSTLYCDVIDDVIDVQITYIYVIWAKESESGIRFEISWELTKLLTLKHLIFDAPLWRHRWRHNCQNDVYLCFLGQGTRFWNQNADISKTDENRKMTFFANFDPIRASEPEVEPEVEGVISMCLSLCYISVFVSMF